MRNAIGLLAAIAITTVLSCSSKSPPAEPASDAGAGTGTGLAKVNHVVVIVLENWTFDSLYAELPGVEGLSNGEKAPPQIDEAGTPYATLPQTETHLPPTLPNAPFALDAYLPTAGFTSTDLTNNFYEEQRQIHGGKMDRFVLFDAAAKGLTMGYYHTAGLPLSNEAQSYTVCDHFFHGVFGGSLQNHIFLISAAVAQFPNAPASVKMAVLDANGEPINGANGKPQDGPLTPDGYVVGTLFPSARPHPPATPIEQLVPPQAFATIGDRLSAKGLDWAWYSEGWDEIMDGATLNEAGKRTTTYTESATIRETQLQ